MDAALVFFWGIIGGITIITLFRFFSDGLYYSKSTLNTTLAIIGLVVLFVAVEAAIFAGDVGREILLYTLAFFWVGWVIEVFSSSPLFLAKRKKEDMENRTDWEPE